MKRTFVVILTLGIGMGFVKAGVPETTPPLIDGLQTPLSLSRCESHSVGMPIGGTMDSHSYKNEVQLTLNNDIFIAPTQLSPQRSDNSTLLLPLENSDEAYFYLFFQNERLYTNILDLDWSYPVIVFQGLDRRHQLNEGLLTQFDAQLHHFTDVGLRLRQGP